MMSSRPSVGRCRRSSMTKESSSPPVTLPPSSASDPSGPVVHRVDEFGRPVGEGPVRLQQPERDGPPPPRGEGGPRAPPEPEHHNLQDGGGPPPTGGGGGS